MAKDLNQYIEFYPALKKNGVRFCRNARIQ